MSDHRVGISVLFVFVISRAIVFSGLQSQFASLVAPTPMIIAFCTVSLSSIVT